jgi:FHS family L-fucose permease-like MFS transporter
MVHGAVMDEVGAAMGYIVPGICLALVAAYALYDMTHQRSEVVTDSALAEQ